MSTHQSIPHQGIPHQSNANFQIQFTRTDYAPNQALSVSTSTTTQIGKDARSVVCTALTTPSQKKRRGRPRKATTVALSGGTAGKSGGVPNLVEILSVAQRALGVDFGEGAGVVVPKEAADESEPETVPQSEVKTRQRLPEKVKAFIVIQNACGQSPRQVVKAVKEKFGLVITAAQVESYDPTKANGQTLRLEYKQLYGAMAREYRNVLLRVGIADQDYRLVALHELFIEARDSGQIKLAAHILEQAAKETGGFYVKSMKIPKDSEDNRQLLARLLKCRPEDLLPVPIKTAIDLS